MLQAQNIYQVLDHLIVGSLMVVGIWILAHYWVKFMNSED